MRIPSCVLVISLVGVVQGFSPLHLTREATTTQSSTTTTTSLAALSRRDALRNGAFGIASVVFAAPQLAMAGTTPPSAEDLERIKIGYKQISYLLDNFEQETTGT